MLSRKESNRYWMRIERNCVNMISMTAVEFRMFFDSLPDADSKARITKNTFARESDISMTILKEIAAGKKNLTEAYIARLLPVMRKHGFQG